MKTKAKKVLLSLTSLALTGALGATVVLTEPSKSKATATSAVRGYSQAIDVTGQYMDQLGSEKYINKDLAVEPQSLRTRSDGTRRIIVEFESDSLLDNYLGDTRLQTVFKDFTAYVGGVSGRQYASSLEREQSAFFKALDKKAFDYELRHSYTSLLNAVSLSVNDEDVSSIGKMSGVKNIIYSEAYEIPAVEATTNVVNVYGTGIYDSSDVSYTGEGMLVAVLDTGLDRSHPAFQNMPSVQKVTRADVEKVFDKLEATTYGEEISVSDVYYNAKVPFAYDYADKDADVFPKSSSHGVHVAGIIAGEDDSVTADDGEAFENETKFIGVAPDAQLMIGKVFPDSDDGLSEGAETDDILAALSDCVTVGADVINMSLGSSCGFSREEDGSAINAVYDKVYAAGINLVVAASNDYSAALNGAYGSTNLTSNPDSATVGSPSTYVGALSVASISGQKSSYMQLDDGTAVYFNEASNAASVKGDFVAELLNGSDSKQFNYVVVPGYGKENNYNSSVMTELKKGNCIAVVCRGDISFEEKQRIAYEKGAVACIIYNNVSGMISATLGTGKKVPTCTVSAEIGQMFKNKTSGTITLDKTFKAGPFMSDFSSWGPTNDLKIKPEITAHGGEITSSVVGGYNIYSGTSMASPNMAGAVTLLRQHVEEKYGLTGVELSERVNQLLMSTATIVRDESGLPYSVRKQGAGLGDISKAVSTDAYIYVENNSKPKLELGDDPDKKGVYTMEFTVSNTSSSAKTYEMDVIAMTESISIDGITVAEKAYMLDKAQKSFRVDGKATGSRTLTVPAGSDTVVSVTLSLSAEEKAYLDKNFENGMYVEGFVTLTDLSGENGVDLSVPYLAFYGDWTDAPIFDKSEYEVSEEHYDPSIPDEEKAVAAGYASVAIGRYAREEEMYLPLGEYVYNVPDGTESGIASSVDKIAVGDSDYGIYEFYAMYFGLLRGAREMTVEVKNSVTGEVIKSETLNNVRKSHGGTPAFANLEMSPYDLGLQNNTKYDVVFTAKLDYENGKEKIETQQYSFYVDYELPVIYDREYRYEYDSSDKVSHVWLDLYLYDNHYVQSLQIFAIPSEDGIDTLTEYPIPVDGTRGGINKVSVEITDWLDNFANNIDEYKNQIGIRIDDYALNAAAYVIPVELSTVDSVTVNYTYENDNREKITDSLANGEIVLQPGEDLDLTDGRATVVASDVAEGQIKADFTVTLFNYATYECTHLDAHGIACGYVYNENEGLTYKKGDYFYNPDTGKTEQKTETEKTPAYPAHTLFTDIIAEPVTGNSTPASKHFVCPKCGTEVTFTFNSRKQTITPKTFEKTTQDPRIEDVSWVSNNPEVVSVSNGRLYAVAEGVAEITVNDQFSFKVSVTGEEIKTYLEELSIGYYINRTLGVKRVVSDGAALVDCGSTLDLYPSFKPWYITGVEDLSWSSSNSDIVEITEATSSYARVVCKQSGSVRIQLSSKSLGRIGTFVLVVDEEYTLNSYYFYEYNGVGYSELYTDENGEERKMLVIPANLGIINMGYFTTTRNGPFYQNTDIDTVIVPEGVTTLGVNCFAESSLRRIYLPSSLITVAYNAFKDCANLEEVYWYNAGEKSKSGIEYDADYNTYNWEAFFDPETGAGESCTSQSLVVGSDAFASCPKLKVFDFSRVTGVYSGAFKDCASLVYADLSRVRFSGRNVFNGCSGLESVTLQASTAVNADMFSGTGVERVDYYGESVPDSTFANATSLKEIVFRNDLEFVGSKAFYKCTSLEKVTFEGSCGYFGASAFEGCSALGEFTLPADLRLIGARTFAKCTSLAALSVDSAALLDEIGTDVFADCDSLKKIEIVGANDKYATVSSADGEYKYLTNKEGTEVILVPPTYRLTAEDDERFTLPAEYTSVGAQAYAHNASLDGKELVIPEGVKEIGFAAFQGTGITKVVIPSSVEIIGEYAFGDCVKLETVVFLCDLKELPGYLFYNSTALTNVQIPDSVRKIGISAFEGTGIKTLEIGANVEEIGEAAFAECIDLAEVTFAEQGRLASLGEYAFYDCISLTGLRLADSISVIGSYAFANCSDLAEVYISGGLKEMGYYVFGGDTALKTVTFGYGAELVGDYAFAVPSRDSFSTHSNLKNVTIPETVKYIGAYAFVNNIAMTSIDLRGAEFIGDGAFMGTQKLKTVTLDERTEYIGMQAFMNSAVENIDLSGVEYFDSLCFYGTNLKTGDLLSAIVIGSGAFYNCRSITSVYLPNAEDIYDSAFYVSERNGNQAQTGKIASVRFGDKLKSLGGGAFYNSVITEIELPASLEVLGVPAFAGCLELSEIRVADGNSVFFVDDSTGALYKNLGDGAYELVSVPNALHMEGTGEDMTPFEILDGTVRIGGYAMAFCHYIHAVEIPASVKSIGSAAFYGFGLAIIADEGNADEVETRVSYPKYIFKGLEAPVLETEYDRETFGENSDMSPSFAYLYLNFGYNIGYLVNDMVIPVNATGFESLLYNYFFMYQEYSEELIEAGTQALVNWLNSLNVNELTLSDEQTVGEMNTVYFMLKDGQKAFVSSTNREKLTAAVEKIETLKAENDDSEQPGNTDSSVTSADSSSASADSSSGGCGSALTLGAATALLALSVAGIFTVRKSRRNGGDGEEN